MYQTHPTRNDVKSEFIFFPFQKLTNAEPKMVNVSIRVRMSPVVMCASVT